MIIICTLCGLMTKEEQIRTVHNDMALLISQQVGLLTDNN